MPNYDQTNRLLAMHSATLGDDLACLTELRGEDTISRPFLFRIRFTTEEPIATVRGMLGTPVTLEFGHPNTFDAASGRRPLHGIIRSLVRRDRVPLQTQAYVWEAEVVPRLWFLSQTSDCRIFQDMTIPDIVRNVLEAHGLAARYLLKPPTMLQTSGTLEYCVQYNETALDFVHRLMEQAGLFYWHEHSSTDHTLVISESNTYARVPTPSVGTLTKGGAGWMTRFDEHCALRTGAWTVRDYNMLVPDTPLDRTSQWADIAGAPTAVAERMRERELYLYPGLYIARVHTSTYDFQNASGAVVAQTDATTMGDLLMELEEASWQRCSADSQAAVLDAGTKVTIEPDTGEAASDFLILGVTHNAADYSHWTPEMWGTKPVIPTGYTNSFTCLPFATRFRPDRVTPKPRVEGPQTAIVTGPAGEEIHTDSYGRVKLKFPWDRASPATPDASSCWIRVAQGWAGGGWGQVHLPRVGQEVIVEFLEGDPDRPLVTGRVYDYSRMQPYSLPSNKAKSGIRTRSYPGGTSENYNELRFDDAIGSEAVLLHAEKDYTIEVENNETRTVGIGSKTGNRTTTIKGDDSITVGITGGTGNRTTSIMGNDSITIGGDETRVVTGNQNETINGSLNLYVTGDLTLSAENITQTTRASENTSTSNYQYDVYNNYGASYVMANYQGAFNTNVWAVMSNATGVQMNVTGVALGTTGVSVGYTGISVNTGNISWSNKAISGEDRLVKMESTITTIGRATLRLQDSVLYLMA